MQDDKLIQELQSKIASVKDGNEAAKLLKQIEYLTEATKAQGLEASELLIEKLASAERELGPDDPVVVRVRQMLDAVLELP